MHQMIETLFNRVLTEENLFHTRLYDSARSNG
jgi:hypothetical protein